MGHEWDAHTAVEATPDGFSAELDPGWVVGGGVNGGYLLGVVGRAIGETVPDKPDPLAVSAFYVSASRPGPATVRTRVVRDGGSTATVAAELSQGDDTRITALATYGDLSRAAGRRAHHGGRARPAARRGVLLHLRRPGRRRSETPPLMERFDMRFDPACVGWALGQPSGRGLLQAWFRLADGREPDPLQLLMVLDALPPVTFDLGHMGWAPTLELTAHVRAVPAPGWLKVVAPHPQRRRRDVRGGLRGLGLGRPPRRAEPPARALPAPGLTTRADGRRPAGQRPIWCSPPCSRARARTSASLQNPSRVRLRHSRPTQAPVARRRRPAAACPRRRMSARASSSAVLGPDRAAGEGRHVEGRTPRRSARSRSSRSSVPRSTPSSVSSSMWTCASVNASRAPATVRSQPWVHGVGDHRVGRRCGGPPAGRSLVNRTTRGPSRRSSAGAGAR